MTNDTPAGRRVAKAGEARDGRTGRRGDTRAAVFEAAVELFARNGVSATSVDDIAARAGVAKGSVYYNFGSKAGLVDELLGWKLGRLRDHLADAIGESSGWAAVRAVVHELLAQVEAHPHTAKLFAAEFFRTDRDWHATTLRWQEEMAGLVEQSLVRGQREGAVDGGLDTGIAAAGVFGAALMAGLSWRLFSPERPLAEVVAAVQQVVTGGADQPRSPARQ